ncbi:hypothetical protein FP2506_02040 [Fulvimarina pelagi HTCC2506]|uniref:Uncharacterized protein n=1 Tax=Fulvimarina pelagi HTCC2506 TaxID=314231 RepID=Q0FYL2_9HYPH|nr:hypothetical protein FP2506_02040 [Fulvimarina pelagi HTCC2506]
MKQPWHEHYRSNFGIGLDPMHQGATTHKEAKRFAIATAARGNRRIFRGMPLRYR